MSTLIEKLKNLFSSNGLSVTAKKVSTLPQCIRINEDPDLLWTTAEQIGDGAYGKIYKAVNKVTGVDAALKRIHVDEAADIGDYIGEIEILNMCIHANVIRLLDSFYISAQLSIYIEYCVGGSIDSIMHELERPLSELQIGCVCRQICSALEYIHSCGIIHRDIKAGNILLTADGTAKLADFGVSAMDKAVGQKHNTFIGSPFWMAPEVICCETDKTNYYNSKVDIWSFGVTLIELAQIEPPNHNMNPSRVLMKIRLGDPPTLNAPHKWSEEFNDIISKCLQKDPVNRPTSAQLCGHPFVTSRRSGDVQSLIELVIEVKAEVMIQVTDVDSVDLVNGVCSDTQSADFVCTETSPPVKDAMIGGANSVLTDAVVSSRIQLQETSDMNIHKAVDGSLEQSPLVSDKSDDVRFTRASIQKQAVEQEVQIMKFKFDEDEEYNESDEKMVPSTQNQFDQAVFANSRGFALLRHDAFVSGHKETDGPSAPVISSFNPNFSRQKVRYQSLTKTRKYVYEGKVVTRQTTKVIVSGTENLEQEERAVRKAEQRAMQLLQRAENRQREEFEEKMSVQRHQLEKQLEQRRQMFMKSYADELELLDREHRHKIKKMETAFSRQLQYIMERLKVQQERDLKSFRQELKFSQQQAHESQNGQAKGSAWSSVELFELDAAAKERKFVDQQQSFYDRKLRQAMSEHHSRMVANELALLTQKQQLLRCREAAVWEIEERHLLESGALKKQYIQQLYELLRRQLVFRHSQELELAHRANDRGLTALQRRLAADTKQFNKHVKKEYRSRKQAFIEDHELHKSNSSFEQALRQFDENEKKRMRQLQEENDNRQAERLIAVKTKNAAVIAELEQLFEAAQLHLMEKETSLLAEEEAKLLDDLRSFRESLVDRKKLLETELLHERMKLDLASIQLTDVEDLRHHHEVVSRPRQVDEQSDRMSPNDEFDQIFGDQTSTVF